MFKNLLKEYQEGYLYLFSDRSFYKKLWTDESPNDFYQNH